MKKLALIGAALILSACATPYGKYGLLGGFTDKRIDENTFSISVDTNGYTSKQTTSMHALYRAAELTVENGYDYFVIVDTSDDTRSMTMAQPGTSYTTVNAYGSTAYARTTRTPGFAIPVVFPNSTITVKSLKGTKPEDNPNAYDARSLMKYLGPQIGVDQNSKHASATPTAPPAK